VVRMALPAGVFPGLKSNLYSSNSSLLLSNKKGVNRFNLGIYKLKTRRLHSEVRPKAMFLENPVTGDLIATALSGGIALSMLRLWEETAKRGVFDQVGPLLSSKTF